MNENFEDFDTEKKNSKKNSDNQLRTLKIIAIVFILILSVAISGYLLYTYIQNAKLSIAQSQKSSQNISENNTLEPSGNSQYIIINSDENPESDAKNDSNESNAVIAPYENSQNESQPTGSVLTKPQTTSSTTTKQETTSKTGTNDSKTSEKTATKTDEKLNNTKTNVKISKQYTVQIASFTDFDKAMTLKNKLENKGISCYIVIIEIDNKYYYRIRSGKFSNKNEALNHINKIKEVDKTLTPIIIEI